MLIGGRRRRAAVDDEDIGLPSKMDVPAVQA
jgi:hypothetical protein